MSFAEIDFCSDSVKIPAASQAVPLTTGGTPRAGDIMQRVIVIVTDTLDCNVLVRDGANGADIQVAGAFFQPGTYSIELGMKSSNVDLSNPASKAGWFATTGAGVSALFVGRFR